MLNILSHREMQIKTEIPPQTRQNGNKSINKNKTKQKYQVIAGAGEDVEKEENSSIDVGNASWYNHSENQFGGSSENWSENSIAEDPAIPLLGI
jgi:rare lipoprotein A (peptidoglycan hydrolase)